MADAWAEGAGEEDISMGESVAVMTMGMVTISATSIGPEVETGAPPVTNV